MKVTIQDRGKECIVEIPDSLIRKACELAYDEDEDQVIGQINGDEWAIRSYEDYKSDIMESRLIVNSSGIK